MQILKMLILLCIMAVAMNAQDFRGVSIAGTADDPTIVNNSDHAVVGWTLKQYAADGTVLPADRVLMTRDLLMKDFPGIQPGQSYSEGNPRNKVKYRQPVARVELDYVLFDDSRVRGLTPLDWTPLRHSSNG
jgi:hypothetical protein